MSTTKQYTVYKFDELSPAAQEKAHSEYLSNGFEYHWSDEWKQSLEGFCNTFPVEVKNWEVSTCSPSFATVRLSGYGDDVTELKGTKLKKYILSQWYAEKIKKDCPFTGYCGDEDILAPMRSFLKNPDKEKTMLELMEDCVQSWIDGWKNDMEYQESFDYFKEHAEANDYDFTEDGIID